MSKSGSKKISKKNNQELNTKATIEVENTGNYLRTIRLGKGLSIKDVTEATRISEANLNAIEDQNYSALPANTFTKGLLNIYATFLETDAEAIVTKFMEEREASSSQKKRSRPKQPRTILKPKRLAEPTHVSSMTMAGVLFLVIVISFTGFCLYTSWNPFSFLAKETSDIQSAMKSVFPGEKNALPPAKDEIIEVIPEQVPLEQIPSEEKAVSEESSDSIPSSTETQSAVPVEENQISAEETSLSETVSPQPLYTVRIHFLQDTTVEMTRDDYEPIETGFTANDVQTWTADASMILSFSMPYSAEIFVNDTFVTFPEIPNQNGTYFIKIPQDTPELQTDE